jgi:transcriptional accessory protein Tex/SPT6
MASTNRLGYFEFKESVQTIPPHRILAINRGEKEGVLKVRLDYPAERVRTVAQGAVPLGDHPHKDLLTGAFEDALTRLVLPSLEREIRQRGAASRGSFGRYDLRGAGIEDAQKSGLYFFFRAAPHK